MAKIAEEMDRLTNQLNKLKAKFEPLDDKFTKLMEVAAQNGDNALESKNILITIKRSGYDAKAPKYKEAWTLLMTKVNAKIKKQGQDCLDASTEIKHISAKLAVQYKESVVKEGNIVSRTFDRIKVWIEKKWAIMVNRGNEIERDLNKVNKLLNI